MHHDREEEHADTPGSLPQERVEDRENVGTVKPQDYPDAQATDASGSGRPAGRDDQMEDERLHPGAAHGETPASADKDSEAKRQPFNGNEA